MNANSMTISKRYNKEKASRRKDEKAEEPETPKYRDRAKERREDQNPDYEPAELGSFHAVAPPGTVETQSADAHKISIEKSKYLGGDVEHTHLVKGLDYALLNKVRSEIDKKPDFVDDADGKARKPKEDQQLLFRTVTAKSVYQWMVDPQAIAKTNEMFLPGRMAFIFNMESGYFHDIPTTLHRSKADCPVPEEMITVSVDGSVLDRITTIMSYLRLGSSGKILKKKKKEKYIKEKMVTVNKERSESNEEAKHLKTNTEVANGENGNGMAPPPQATKKKQPDFQETRAPPQAAREEEDDIFVGEGIDYVVPGKEVSHSPTISEDMEESPRNRERMPYFDGHTYGAVPPSAPAEEGWQDLQGYEALQAQALQGSYQEDWQGYQYAADQMAYHEQYSQQQLQAVQAYEIQAEADASRDPRLMTQDEKDRGFGSVFKRDDQRLLQLREKDARERDPNFISESYSECYPGYQEYNREVVDSDDEADLSKMDMGGRAKGRLHRWDFETEEEWAKYNEQKEAMPKAAFQFGIKMQDGRKTRKQNRDQKLNNELHQISKLLSRKKIDEANADDAHFDDDVQSAKKLRI